MREIFVQAGNPMNYLEFGDDLVNKRDVLRQRLDTARLEQYLRCEGNKR